MKKYAVSFLAMVMLFSCVFIAPVTNIAEEETETLTVMVWDRGNAAPNTTNDDNPLVDWVKEQVLEHANVEVNYSVVPRSGSDDKLNIMMAGKTAPDVVFTYDQAIFSNYATNGGLADLTEAYAEHGDQIREYAGEIQSMGVIDDQQFAIMKQRQGSVSRHVQYIRTDWLDALGLDIPETKDELFEALYAFRDENPGDVDVIPWMMSGTTDTEKLYLNFVGSYTGPFESERDMFVYSEAYVIFREGGLDGLRKLNELYNDGIIYEDFVTDTTEDLFKQEISRGNVGFTLTDTTQLWDLIPVMKENVEGSEFTPISAMELSDGSYRNGAEPLYGMFIMVPEVSSDKVNAAVKYLNWMVDPVVAENIQYTPLHVRDENGIPIPLTEAEGLEASYPGTPADLNIMNERFEYAQSKEGIVAAWVTNPNHDWADEEWFENAYDIFYENGHFVYPGYPAVIDAETRYGANVKTLAVEYVYKLITANPEEFDAVQATEYEKLVTAGLEDILNERGEWYDANVG